MENVKSYIFKWRTGTISNFKNNYFINKNRKKLKKIFLGELFIEILTLPTVVVRHLKILNLAFYLLKLLVFQKNSFPIIGYL
jgi:hypothetical protein